MKSIISCLVFIGAVFLTSSCTNVSDNGELVGVTRNPYYEDQPLGMVYVPSGSFNMGANDQSAFFVTSKQNKQVNVESFWMDNTEITNSEYRQFVEWLRDYLIRVEIFQQGVGEESDLLAQQDDEGNILWLSEEEGIPLLNMETKIDMRDLEIKEAINEAFYFNNRFEGSVFDVSKLNYTYSEIDLLQAAKKINRLDPVTATYEKVNRTDRDLIRKDTSYVDEGEIVRETNYVQLRNRTDFFKTKSINIYPDTLSWMRNYTYSFNEPYTLYFSHPGYADYPVVGVSWEQANAFCHWRTSYKNAFLKASGQPIGQPYRLPTEAEWEYAARGGHANGMYPWAGLYIRRKDGCYLANYKPAKGDYHRDGYNITSIVGAFPANDYGLFDMAGNVSEWTVDADRSSSMAVINELNPSFVYDVKNVDPDSMRKKVVKGGSWKDVGAFLQCGMKSSEYLDATMPYVGFRCVRTVIKP